jgi:Ca2+-binding EF-hand superfamily protein
MRSFTWAVGLAVLPAAIAGAQLLDPGDKPAGARPAAKRDANAPGAAGAAGANRNAAGPPRSNAMFDAIDADGDGIITKLELRKAIKALRTLDSDADGNITLAEANVGGGPVGPAAPGKNDAQIAQFMANDLNGDGKLSPNEVPNNLLPILQNADRNQDGAIDRQELAAALANARGQFGGPQGGAFDNRGGNLGGARNAADPNEVTGRFLQNDRNGDGRLTPEELPAESARMLQNADRNGDGAIDAGELQEAVARMGGRARAAGLDIGGNRREMRVRELGDRERARLRDQN